MQAGLRGDGGGDTNSAADIRTVKALLLNGAVKPADWTNVAPSPLDYRYGAGVLNVFNSYEQLAGGKHGFIVSTTGSTGGAHPPTGAAGTVGVLSGWDFNTNTSGKFPSQFDAVNHYYFNVTNGASNATFTATMTLVWNRQQNQTAINDLNLFLYNCANSNLVACSTSLVDNVEHIFVPKLAPGRYDLQVWKAGGSGIVSASEIYALGLGVFLGNLERGKIRHERLRLLAGLSGWLRPRNGDQPRSAGGVGHEQSRAGRDKQSKRSPAGRDKPGPVFPAAKAVIIGRDGVSPSLNHIGTATVPPGQKFPARNAFRCDSCLKWTP